MFCVRSLTWENRNVTTGSQSRGGRARASRLSRRDEREGPCMLPPGVWQEVVDIYRLLVTRPAQVRCDHDRSLEDQ